MKNLFGLLFTVLGAYIWQEGYNMLTPAVKDEYTKKLVAKFAFLTKRSPDKGGRW
jgi:hypothetical protein